MFYKNNCHKLNITKEDLLGKCVLPSQDAAIVICLFIYLFIYLFIRCLNFLFNEDFLRTLVKCKLFIGHRITYHIR